MAECSWTGDLEGWAALLAAPESHPLGPAAKLHRGSSHRTEAPDTTVARLQPHLAGLGITRVADVTGLDRVGLPVVSVCRPNARSVTVAMGKGLDQASARASGLMEAAEIAHAERIGAPLRLRTPRELGAEARLIEPLPPPPPGARPMAPDDDGCGSRGST
jgi:ribosomal protein S12 methylthiotransferase accessory factor